MKKIVNILCVITMMIFSTSSCVAQSKMFKEAAKYDGVTTVYVSPMMCKMAMASSDGIAGVDGLGDGIKKIGKVEILTCENSKDQEKVVAVCRRIIDSMHMDVLTEVDQKGEHVTIYTRMADNGNDIKDLMIESLENNEYTVVYIEGEFDIEKIMSGIESDN